MPFIKAFALLLLIVAAPPQTFAADADKPSRPQVKLETDLGDIVIELYPDKAPVTVENFLNYVRTYHYHGVIFHRVIKGFMIQTGGYGFDLYPREPGEPIINESANGLKNRRGTVAMARLPDPDSARAQFFINLANNKHLNAKKDEPGYTVFGKVISGMDSVDRIANTKTRAIDDFANLPVKPISILRAKVLTDAAEGTAEISNSTP
ncbi:MAG: peptidylprolyl isomerase [bacterium]